ncbi:MAG: cytochrome c oxidase subunit II [Actinomycetota bacterium]
MQGRSNGSRRAFMVLAATVLLLLAGCAEDAPMDFLEPEGPEARDINGLMTYVWIIAAFVFVLIEGGILFIAWKFRQRKGHEDDIPVQFHGSTKLEIGWTVVPALILAAIAIPTVAAVFDQAEKPDNALEISVYGQQWWWEYRYEDMADGGADIVLANELVIPAGQPVYLSMTSRDVIHSHWFPKLNGKKDVAPGRTHHMTLEADPDDAGQSFLGQCAEYCGLSHANMRNKVRVLSPDDFEQWLDDMAQEAREPESAAEQEGQEVFLGRGCAACHTIRGVSEPEQEIPLKSGAAPDLTHFADRTVFAGATFEVNRNNVERWIRDPQKMKPMAADLGRGMPDLGLTEEEIDKVAAYLLSLK